MISIDDEDPMTTQKAAQHYALGAIENEIYQLEDGFHDGYNEATPAEKVEILHHMQKLYDYLKGAPS